jgi:hypothetical protein
MHFLQLQCLVFGVYEDTALCPDHVCLALAAVLVLLQDVEGFDGSFEQYLHHVDARELIEVSWREFTEFLTRPHQSHQPVDGGLARSKLMIVTAAQ